MTADKHFDTLFLAVNVAAGTFALNMSYEERLLMVLSIMMKKQLLLKYNSQEPKMVNS